MLKDLKIRCELEQKEPERYCLNGFDIWFFKQDPTVVDPSPVFKVYIYPSIDSTSILFLSGNVGLVEFAKALPTAKSGELHINSNNPHIMNFLKKTNCI